MSFAKRLLLFALVFALAGIIVIFLAPLLVADGLRLILLWKGHQQGVKIAFHKIDAPFLKPVVIHGLRVTSVRPCLFQVALSVEEATLDLNLRALFARSNARVLHGVWMNGLRCEIRRDPRETTECSFDWRFLHRLLADHVKLTNLDLRVSNGNMEVELRGAEFSASEIESGKFSAREVGISAPLFHQRFSDLRGATKWENDHLTLGALSLTRGLDLETLTADFSGLEKKRIGLELNLDAFGGKVRASIASENREKGIIWNVAGSASAISLAQMSTALGFNERAGGSVRASKFTFHGDLQNLSRATATIWTEVSGFTWRDRVAETVMLGASLYNRQVGIEQLYVKQRKNQFTLNGEYTLPAKSADWINPNFRTDISASINDLGEFAKLFGGSPDNFSGSLTISGTVNGRERNLGGQITVQGDALRLWAAPVDMLRAKLSLKGSQLSFDSLRARTGDDFLNATGQADLAREHRYSAKVNGAIANLADYSSLLPTPWRALRPEGRASIGWDGHGTATAHSGDFRIQLENVRLTSNLGWRLFDAKFDGTYSPQNIFFREFRLSNERASFNAFVTVASNYLQLQTLHFDLNGKSKLQGNVFIPMTSHRWLRSRSLGDLNQTENFDIDLMLDGLDLAELQSALTDGTGISGNLSGRLEAYDSLPLLQSKLEAHLRDFTWSDPHPLSADVHAKIISDALKLNLLVNATNSDPVKIEAALPLQLASSTFLAWDKTLLLKLSCPAVWLPKLPRYLTRKIFHDGILSGNIDASGTLRSPKVTGEFSLLNGRFVKSPGPLDGLSAGLEFHDNVAEITFVNLDLTDTRAIFRGTIDFSDTSKVSIKLIPVLPLFDLTSISPANCVEGVNIFALKRPASEKNEFVEVQQIDLAGGIASSGWNLTVVEHGPTQSLHAKSLFSQTFSLCKAEGGALQFAVPAPQKNEFGQRASNIFRGRNNLRESLTLP